MTRQHRVLRLAAWAVLTPLAYLGAVAAWGALWRFGYEVMKWTVPGVP